MRYLLAIFFILTLITYSFADSFVGRWAWMQHTTNFSGAMSLCVGDLVVRKDKTFWIWNVCKINDLAGGIAVEAEGTWEKVGKNLYRAYYGCYYYDVFIKGDVGVFASMSTCDEFDRGNMEFGIMFKGVKIDNLRYLYERR